MNTTETTQRRKHHGHNVKRLREIIGIKQEILAQELGVNQQRISAIEKKEELDDELMERIAEILKMPKEAIENFDEEGIINIISNTVNNNDSASGNSLFNYYPTIYPIEKLMEALKKNEELYEKLLQSEKEKNDLLQQLLDKKK